MTFRLLRKISKSVSGKNIDFGRRATLDWRKIILTAVLGAVAVSYFGITELRSVSAPNPALANRTAKNIFSVNRTALEKAVNKIEEKKKIFDSL